ncbi:mevalonate kinase-like [Nylanderia fulva]|uniref:mevalonate kinase-like n=1 Tax=Nylanderia fulva TaxID=613905 RepID=UPI0010FB23E6|nr:mevalonate kinase-like [Nylanderia fulva]
MASFKISAPGRIILAGEHIALYGKKFLATSLDLRTHLEFCELPNTPENNIKIELVNINLKRNISLEEVRLFCSRFDTADMISNPIDMHKYVEYMITVRKCMWTTDQERFSLQIFFFLLYSIYYHEHLEIKPFGIKVSTDIEILAGLGSSTSFAVCLAACFLHWQRLQSGCHHTEFSDADLASIKRYTVSCEKSTLHYTFPDVDAHVCTYGQIVKCQCIDYKMYNIDPTNMKEMDILLIDSNFCQDTYTETKQIATLKANTPEFNSMLNRLEVATEDKCITVLIH